MKRQIQQPVSPTCTVSSSLVRKHQEVVLKHLRYCHAGDDQTQLYAVHVRKRSGCADSASWLAAISQCFTILKNTTSGSVTILAASLVYLLQRPVFPKYLLPFLDNFSTLLVLKP